MMENTVSRTVYGLTISVYPAGEFTNDAGETIEFQAGIKIRKGSESMKVDALQVAALYNLLRDDDELRAALGERLAGEVQTLPSL